MVLTHKERILGYDSRMEKGEVPSYDPLEDLICIVLTAEDWGKATEDKRGILQRFYKGRFFDIKASVMHVEEFYRKNLGFEDPSRKDSGIILSMDLLMNPAGCEIYGPGIYDALKSIIYTHDVGDYTDLYFGVEGIEHPVAKKQRESKEAADVVRIAKKRKEDLAKARKKKKEEAESNKNKKTKVQKTIEPHDPNEKQGPSMDDILKDTDPETHSDDNDNLDYS